MKASLFTTPHKGSSINYALDAQREMDHQDVLKAFRSGATMESVLPCMSLIDSYLTAGQVLILEANLVLLHTCCRCCYSKLLIFLFYAILN
jgi:cephalosporin hydroxylase